MDRVEKLLDEIRRLPELARLDRRASSFLNDVAEIYERDGAGVAKTYLLKQQAKRQIEVRVLLSVIERLEACAEVRVRRAIGRQVIKCLYELKGGAGR